MVLPFETWLRKISDHHRVRTAGSHAAPRDERRELEDTASPDALEALRDAAWCLEERDASFRAMIEAHAELMIGRDQAGIVRFMNEAACKTFSVAAGDVVGRTFRPANAQVVDSTGDTSLGGDVVERIETNAGPRWISWTVNRSPLPDSDVLDLWIGRDVTDMRNLMTELEKARDAALAANKAKSTFLAAMSHEIRTPMNGILGMAGLLADADNTEDRTVYIETIRQSAHALVALIDEILDFSAIEAGEVKLVTHPFEVEPLIENVKLLLRPRAHGKGLGLTFDIDDKMPRRIVGDDARIRQMVINLVSNAIKFTETGAVSVRLFFHPANDGKEPTLEISVSDTGVGLSREEQRFIFVEFARAEAAIRSGVPGSGLGLAITQRLVAAMRGTLAVDSEPGKGATFTLCLPVEPADETETDARPSDARSSHADTITDKGCSGDRPLDRFTAAPFSGRPPFVLIAEDNAVNALLAERIVARLGCRVVRAVNGVEAVEKVTAALSGQSGPIDVVLMDIFMPAMDGLEATRRIRGFESDSRLGDEPLPIIGLTANAYREDREACQRAGMSDYLAKPFDPDQLTRLLVRWLPQMNHHSQRAGSTQRH